MRIPPVTGARVSALLDEARFYCLEPLVGRAVGRAGGSCVGAIGAWKARHDGAAARGARRLESSSSSTVVELNAQLGAGDVDHPERSTERRADRQVLARRIAPRQVPGVA